MIYSFWRLNEYTPDNLGLAFTDDGLLLGQTPLVERRDGRFVARERSEIERLLKRAHPGAPPVDRIISGLATVASALNANDQCLARIAAVHLRIPELPSSAARAALAAEDTLIKYARDEGSTSSALKRMRQRSRRGWVSAAVRRKSALWLPQRQVSSSRKTRPVITAEGRSIPDALTDTMSVEIKDSAYVSATRQMRIQAEAAETSGRESILITGTKTKISRKVWELFNRVIQRSDLGPQ
jgi:hypothetical protein